MNGRVFGSEIFDFLPNFVKTARFSNTMDPENCASLLVTSPDVMENLATCGRIYLLMEAAIGELPNPSEAVYVEWPTDNQATDQQSFSEEPSVEQPSVNQPSENRRTARQPLRKTPDRRGVKRVKPRTRSPYAGQKDKRLKPWLYRYNTIPSHLVTSRMAKPWKPSKERPIKKVPKRELSPVKPSEYESVKNNASPQRELSPAREKLNDSLPLKKIE